MSQELGDVYGGTLKERAAEMSKVEQVRDNLNDQLQAVRVYVLALQNAREQEAARQQAIMDEKASLAQRIVNEVLTVTLLRDKFAKTQIMGYDMEAEKHLSSLHSLILTNRALLDHAAWKAVDDYYNRDLPGLTVWQARYAENLLAAIKQQ